MKKLTYKRQLILTVVIVLVFNLLNSLFKHWIFTSIGYALCGLLWFLHPVMIGDREPRGDLLNLIRAAGIALIVMAFFTRSYLY